jgi:MFS transporter, DHA2 family, multidrug resistance protein
LNNYPKGFAKIIIVLTTIVAAIMELIDTSIVNVALTKISGNLGVNIEDVSWVITAYAIANVIIIPMTGFLGEYFGRKNYYLVSMILFTVASYFCGASTGLWELVAWRFVQGIGGGALLSTSQAILFDAFPPEKRAVAGGFFGMGIVLGPTLGPTVGGLILDNFDNWGYIFYVNIPIGILASYFTFTFIDKKVGEGQKKDSIKIDYLGILLLVAGIGCLQYVLERGEAEDWFASGYIRTCSLIAVLGIVLFIWYELKIKNPVVNLRVLNNRTLAITTIFTFVMGIGLFTSVYVYPVLAQRILGFTPLMTGLTLLPPTLIAVLMFPVIGKRMSTGASPIPFIVIGLLFFIAFGWYGGSLNGEVGRWDFFIPLGLRALGISMLQLPLINASVSGLQPKDYASGISLNNMVRQLGGATGIAVANNYIAHQYAQHKSDLIVNINSANSAFTENFNTITQGIIARTGDVVSVATNKGYKLIDLQVDKQAYLLSYLDTFRLIALFFVLIFPLVFFLKLKRMPTSKQQAAAKKEALSEAH